MKISDYRPPRSAIKPTIACQPLRTRLVNISPKDADDYDVAGKELSKSMKLAYFRGSAVNFTGCRGYLHLNRKISHFRYGPFA